MDKNIVTPESFLRSMRNDIAKKAVESQLNENEEPPCESVNEMAKLCDKVKDGYGFYIYVKNSGPGGARSEHLPMHAHVLTQINPDIDIGCFDLTSETPPADGKAVKDASKKRLLPADVKSKIAEWSKKPNKDLPSATNWAVARAEFKHINPSLFP